MYEQQKLYPLQCIDINAELLYMSHTFGLPGTIVKFIGDSEIHKEVPSKPFSVVSFKYWLVSNNFVMDFMLYLQTAEPSTPSLKQGMIIN